MITVPAVADVTCADAANFVAPTATFSNGETGACEISGTVPGVVDANFTQCGGTITITWTVDPADNCDRPAVVESVTIDVAPAPDPVIAVPAIADVTCDAAASFVAPSAAFSNGETGACEISGVVQGTVAPNFDECGGTITITYTAPTGCDNNSVEEVVVIEVAPAPVPTIDVPAIANLTCTEAASFNAPTATYSNGAGGACDISGTVQGVVEENFTQCGGTITVTWTVPSADNCDRPAVVESVTIDVTPAPDPVIDVPAIADVACDEAASFVAPDATFSNGETGACGISGVVTPTIEPSFDECGGTITITYRAPTGCDNNAVEEVVVINVAPAPEPTFDTPNLPASISCVDAAAFSAMPLAFSNGEAGACEISGTAQGVVTGNFDECGGDLTVTWTVDSADNCGRPAVVLQQVIPVTGPSAPTVSCPAPLSMDCNDPNLDAQIAAWLASATASSECSDVTITNNFGAIDFFNGCSANTGTLEVTFTATDNCGQSTVCTGTITIDDTTPPVFTTLPSDVTFECSDQNLAANVQAWLNTNGNGGAATDDCSAVNFTTDFVGPNFSCEGTTVVTFTAVDECGNSTDAQATLRILDTTAPEILGIEHDIVVSCGQDFAFSMPTVQDLCDNNVELDDPVDSGVLDPCEGGTIIRTFTATDQCGNQVSATQTVTVLPDTDMPTFTSALPTDITVDCDNVPTAPIIEADDCNAVSVEFDESVVIIQCGQVITRTWIATDVCGNSVSHTQIINCLLYTSPSPRDATLSRMPSSA